MVCDGKVNEKEKLHDGKMNEEKMWCEKVNVKEMCVKVIFFLYWKLFFNLQTRSVIIEIHNLEHFPQSTQLI